MSYGQKHVKAELRGRGGLPTGVLVFIPDAHRHLDLLRSPYLVPRERGGAGVPVQRAVLDVYSCFRFGKFEKKCVLRPRAALRDAEAGGLEESLGLEGGGDEGAAAGGGRREAGGRRRKDGRGVAVAGAQRWGLEMKNIGHAEIAAGRGEYA